jgi:hypothetical protein
MITGRGSSNDPQEYSLPMRRILLQIVALGLKTDVRDFPVMAACGRGAGGDKLRSAGRRTFGKS